jgi:hypothetical protein
VHLKNNNTVAATGSTATGRFHDVRLFRISIFTFIYHHVVDVFDFFNYYLFVIIIVGEWKEAKSPEGKTYYW